MRRNIENIFFFSVFVIAVVFINALGWNHIAGIRINTVLAVGMAAVFLIKKPSSLLFIFALLAASIQWQPIVGNDILLLGGIIFFSFLARPYIPWKPSVALIIGICAGTLIMYGAQNPMLFLRAPMIVAIEIVYNVIAGVIVYGTPIMLSRGKISASS